MVAVGEFRLRRVRPFRSEVKRVVCSRVPPVGGPLQLKPNPTYENVRKIKLKKKEKKNKQTKNHLKKKREIKMKIKMEQKKILIIIRKRACCSLCLASAFACLVIKPMSFCVQFDSVCALYSPICHEIKLF